MAVINASDAKTYCLAIAQLIPVFLIALYVIDGSWVTKHAPNNTATNTLQNKYAIRAVYGIILGVAGEIIVLWGTIGLISRLFAVSSGTAIAIYISGILSEAALDRLTWKFPDKWAEFLKTFWLVIVIMTALATFIWIFVTVEIVP